MKGLPLSQVRREGTLIFQEHLGTTAIRDDPLSFSLYLNFYATHISLREGAIRKTKEQDLPEPVAAESRKCTATPAFKVLSGIRTSWPAQRSEVGVFRPFVRINLANHGFSVTSLPSRQHSSAGRSL